MQIDHEDFKTIDMILLIHSEYEKVILEEDMTAKIKLIDENIERGLTKRLERSRS